MIFLAATIALLPGLATVDVKVEKIEYHGWSDSYRISNGTVEVVVVPKIGRVMRYGYPSGPNMLWENPDLAGKAHVPGEWSNFGGDKVWPAPQSDWTWPPDPTIDGMPWEAEVLPDGLRLTSMDGKFSHVKFMREIHLGAVGTEVNINTRMDNTGSPRSLAPWQITQLDNPYSIFLPTQTTSQMPDGWRLLTGSKIDPKYHKLSAGGLTLSLANTSYKFGAFSPLGEITASKGNAIFHMKTKTYQRANYADKGSALQVYTGAGNDKYAELEVLAPLTKMQNGEGAILDVTWSLTQAHS